MALFGMFAVDDLARLAIKKMEQHKETHEIGETVAKEFKSTGVVFAATGGGTSSNLCADCLSTCVADANYDCVECDVTLCGTYSEFVDSEPAEYGWIDGLWKRIKKELKKPLQKKVKKVIPCNGVDLYKAALEKNPGGALNDCDEACGACSLKPENKNRQDAVLYDCQNLCQKAHDDHIAGKF